MVRNRIIAREIAGKYLDKGNPLGWFEELYKLGKKDISLIPWCDLRPNPNLIEWLTLAGDKDVNLKECLVIGCGLDDDSEYLQSLGSMVDAFDISQTAIEICTERFPKSKVNYFVDDLTNLTIQKKYDFVFEAYTLQVLPRYTRTVALKCLPDLLKSTGKLLIICRGKDENDDEGDMPWPITKRELESLNNCLTPLNTEDYFDYHESPPVRRFRNLYKVHQ